MADATPPLGPPLLQPLGDQGLLVRFASALSDEANRSAIAFARQLRARAPGGVTEVQPNLVSVLVKYDPARIGHAQLAGELRLMLGGPAPPQEPAAKHRIGIRYDGPDLGDVAAQLGLSEKALIEQHGAAALRVLATGFAPGFVYCGFHAPGLEVPRRIVVRRQVPAGTVLFAARQTAITATPIPTGWHVIGHTDFANFDPAREPPTMLREGDEVRFEAQP